MTRMASENQQTLIQILDDLLELQWQEHQKMLRSHNITWDQYRVLKIIGSHKRHGHFQVSSQQLIADDTGLSKMMISKLITNLYTKGLVLRINPVFDTRANIIRLSNKGVLLLKDFSSQSPLLIDQVVNKLDPGERQMLQLLLQRIVTSWRL